MKLSRYIFPVVLLAVTCISAYAQTDRKDVRRGNRDFRKEEFREAEIDYMKALVKDSMSVAANYNLASSLFRQGDMEQAGKVLDRVKDVAPATASSADYWYNRGDVALEIKDYQTAVDAFARSLIVRPDDLDAKENFIYAKKMLQNQDNQDQNQDNQDQNQDQNQDDQNDKNNQDQNDQNEDQNDQNQNDQDRNNDQDQGGQDDRSQPQQDRQPKISPQAAQQMLQAIQAKEKETQEKVKEEKAKALKSRQREKNW